MEKVDEVSYDPIEGIVDLLPIQSYFFDQVKRDNFAQEFVLKTNEKLDLDILQNAFDVLSDIHDMLRASYSLDGNNPVQEILPLGTQVCEIGQYEFDDDCDDCLEGNIKEILLRSIDSISTFEKLIDINLIHCNGESYLLLAIHHLIIDGVSWNTLLMDLTYIYKSLKEGKAIEINRPYPYKLWVEDLKELLNNISDEEWNHWIKLNDLLDDSLIEGHSSPFSFELDVNYKSDNLLMLSEEKYLALAISRAYKKTYGKDIIFNRESHGRDETIADLNRSIGWFTSQCPIEVVVDGSIDVISLIKDICSLETAFNNVNNLVLNYQSMIYTRKEFEFKHCPVTFNFLATEFEFKNELFESVDYHLIDFEEAPIGGFNSQTLEETPIGGFNSQTLEEAPIGGFNS